MLALLWFSVMLVKYQAETLRYLEIEQSNENSLSYYVSTVFVPLVATADAAVLLLQCFESSC